MYLVDILRTGILEIAVLIANWTLSKILLKRVCQISESRLWWVKLGRDEKPAVRLTKIHKLFNKYFNSFYT